MSRTSTRHATYPFGIEATSVLAWALLLGGLWLLGRGLAEVPVPLAEAVAGVAVVVGLLLGPVLVGAVMGWAFDDPDDAAVGPLALVWGGGLVLPRAAAVSLLVWFFVGLLITTVLTATVLSLLAFFLSVGAGLLARRYRAE